MPWVSHHMHPSFQLGNTYWEKKERKTQGTWNSPQLSCWTVFVHCLCTPMNCYPWLGEEGACKDSAPCYPFLVFNTSACCHEVRRCLFSLLLHHLTPLSLLLVLHPLWSSRRESSSWIIAEKPKPTPGIPQHWRKCTPHPQDHISSEALKNSPSLSEQ